MVTKVEIEKLISKIEKRRLAVEEKRSILQFETAFFLPLFGLLFLVTYFSTNEAIKIFFYILTILLIIADLIYSLMLFKDLSDKQKRLEEIIHEKLGNVI